MGTGALAWLADRILIHCATGGTGLAAIQIARLLGATVLATAGGPDKRAYLSGVGIEHVMDSRSLDFAKQARAATGGQGVDVVLNSPAGPAIKAGLEAPRPFGRFGKLALTVPQSGCATAVAAPQASVRADGTYLVTGGLRGVGLETVRWLAAQGAGHIVVNGRTPPNSTAEHVLQQLKTQGVKITVVLGDIAENDTAERLVNASGDTPLRGVVHAAMVLDDAVLADITEEQLIRVWRPKVTGAWRLHEATAGHPLDWFVVYSSMSSLLGNPGQGAYAAANSWLDTFAAWRTARGLRTLAIDWGPWGETGVATDFAARGYHTVAEPSKGTWPATSATSCGCAAPPSQQDSSNVSTSRHASTRPDETR